MAGSPKINRREFLADTGVALALGAIALPELLAACTPAGQTGPSAASKTLVYVDSDTPPTFDLDQTGTGLTEQIASMCYGGDVVRYKIVHDTKAGIERADIFASGQKGIDNGLADSIEVSDDLRTFTFHLRKDAKSALGNPLTSEDVLWSFKRSIALDQTGGFFASVMGVSNSTMTAPDKNTVKFTLARPNPIFLRVDSMKYYGGLFDSVAAKAHATASDPWAKEWLAANTAGFDAYTVKSFQKGQQVELSASHNWYRGKPTFDRVIWKAVPDSGNRLSLLLKGDADIAVKLTPPQLKQATGAKGVKVSSYSANVIKSIQLNLRFQPLADYRVRQAIAYAMPYEQILSGVYLGTARPVKSPIPDTYPGYTDEFWTYSTNIDKARQLMKDANQGPFTMTLTYDTSTYDDPLLAPIVKSALKDLGITVNLNGAPNAVYTERLFSHKDEAFLAVNWPFIAHPAYALWVYWKSTTFLNTGGWNPNGQFDTLVDQMLVETDASKLDQLGRQAQQLWEREQPWIMLANPGWHVAHRDTISGLTWFPDNDIRFQELKSA